MTDRLSTLLAEGRPPPVNIDALIGSIEGALFGGAAPPKLIGHYEVVRRLGAGAHATVYAAFDRRLRREVALKLLHRCLDSPVRERLNREARALAAVDHPNLVRVFDTGHYASAPGCRGSFIVMELVDGQTLREWLAQPRPIVRVLEIAQGMGRGLAALHRTGLVHRDFKPSNVLLGADGVPRVADLGLARTSTSGSCPSGLEPLLHDRESSTTLTRTGEAPGTPLYMAPEQHAGQEVGPAADQFAFCLSVVEALVGRRPFAAADEGALWAAKRHGLPRSVVRRIPRRLRAALQRGLRCDPLARWPNMDALLAALGARSWMQRGAGLAVTGATGLVLVGVSSRAPGEEQPGPCAGASEQLGGVWDEAVRSDVHRALVRQGAGYRASVSQRSLAELDLYANAWTKEYAEACESAPRQGQRSAPQDRRILCLQRARTDLNATVSALTDADDDVAARAHHVVDGLPALSDCADPAPQHRKDAPARADRVAVHEVESLLAHANARMRAGQLRAAHDAVLQAKQHSSAAEYPPIWAEIALAEGRALEHLGQYAAAERALHEALRAALLWRVPDVAADAAAGLVFVVGARQARPSEGLRFLDRALRGAPSPDALSNVAAVFYVQGRYEEAERAYARALALRLADPQAKPLGVAEARNNLANVLLASGRQRGAEQEYRRALALSIASLSAAHPMVGMSRHNLAVALYKQGKNAEALAEIDRALATVEAALGPEHANVALLWGSRGLVLSALGDHAAAQREHRRSRALLTDALGAGHPKVAAAGGNLANALEAQHAYAEAEAEYRRTLAALDVALGAEHPLVATTRHNLGNVLRSRGQYDDAVREYRRALRLRRAHFGSEHPDVAASRSGLAGSLLRLGDTAQALPLAEAAWARRRHDDIALQRRGRTAFVLAQALWSQDTAPHARARALELAQDAWESLRADGAPKDEIAEVREWLRARPSASS